MLNKIHHTMKRVSQPQTVCKTITNLLTPLTRSVHSGKHHSKVVNNGYGKSEFRTESTAVVEDLRESRSASVEKYVEQSTNQLNRDNGMKFNANSH